MVAPDAQKVRVRVGPGFDMTKAPTASGPPPRSSSASITTRCKSTAPRSRIRRRIPTWDPAGRTARSNARAGRRFPRAPGRPPQSRGASSGPTRRSRARGVAPLSTHRPSTDSAARKSYPGLFLGIGAAEGPGTKSFSEALMTAGVHNVYFESPGTAREWLTWRRAFKEFAPRLFR